MELRFLFELERDGMIATIKESTCDFYIRSYLKKLEVLDFENDSKLLEAILVRILTFYDIGNYDKFAKGEYAIQRENQKYTYYLLNHFVEQLNIDYTKPEKVEEDKLQRPYSERWSRVPKRI